MALLLSASHSSLYALLLQTRNHSPFRTFKSETYCGSGRSVHVSASKTNRKPRPSFFEQIRDKWSVKVPSTREKFPWEEHSQQQQDDEKEETETREISWVGYSEAEIDGNLSRNDDSVSLSSPNLLIKAPWFHGTIPRATHFNSQTKNGENVNEIFVQQEENDKAENLEMEVNYNEKFKEEDNNLIVADDAKSSEEEVNYDGKLKGEKVELGDVSVGLTRDKEIARAKDSNSVVSLNQKPIGSNGGYGGYSSLIQLPWEREREMESGEGDWRRKRSNTELAERTLPEHELKRLRNVALRMLERIKVGAAGINQNLVHAIHEKWRLDEVIKLKFEGPLSCNMKRTHEILENRTGGLVIWRSGSSVVLYRGMTYKFRCAKSFSNQNEAGNSILSHSEATAGSAVHNVGEEEDFIGTTESSVPNIAWSFSEQNEAGLDIVSHSEKAVSSAVHNVGVEDFIGATKSFVPDYARCLEDLSREELMDFSELNQLLDELGPRFEDWCGRKPLPVDADLLPAVDPEYKPPYRLLPHGVRPCLRNKEMTVFRRVARTMPPHFALGRSRELQGLAKAMLKLWQRSAIAKIAIKRGVQNTRNDRMAEELKVLTGGVLLSRNKEFIVFYRGNDFLPPAIMETLNERRKLTYLKQDEEEKARHVTSTLVESNKKTTKGSFVAGTLAETIAATTRWRNQLGNEDAEEMLRDAALAKRASLVKHLQNKLALARGKLKRAEKALAKVQEHMDPAELPTDLETISDEERVLFRKIGLSMKPYLLLGRRGVYDGTIENMHLHWKYREVVKIIVQRKNVNQIKRIAVSLEAESGGVLVSVDKTTKGYAIIIYRGKNYLRPRVMRPRNLLTKRQALARSIEIQRREALKHHISDLQERYEFLKSELEEMQSAKKIDAEKTLCSVLDDASVPAH